MKSPVTIGSFDLTTRHDLIMHFVGLSVDCVVSRGGCARVIECNRSSSAHHRVCTFFPTRFNPVGKGSHHAQTTRDMAERQSPDGNKRPRGTPTLLTPVRPNSASS